MRLSVCDNSRAIERVSLDLSAFSAVCYDRTRTVDRALRCAGGYVGVSDRTGWKFVGAERVGCSGVEYCVMERNGANVLELLGLA
jgi:hypothetical protein